MEMTCFDTFMSVKIRYVPEMLPVPVQLGQLRFRTVCHIIGKPFETPFWLYYWLPWL